MSGPTIDTHGIFASDLGIRANLRGLPLGAPATQDPDNDVTQFAALAEFGPGGYPLGQPIGQYLEHEIALQLENVTGDQFEIFADLVARLNGRAVKYSPVGSTSYGADDWTLVSTTNGWVETSFNRWAGPLVMWRKGAEIV
jgi:hypothetical protein